MIDIEIPGELITYGDNEINFNFLKNKKILGCTGYSKSGKDTLGRIMVERLGFKRISFGDVLKKDLNDFMIKQVHQDLIEKNKSISINDIDFLKPKSSEIKEVLRPYMIWFGEIMKQKNGIHHWTNRAFAQIGDSKKIVITDVRRINELDIFKSNREFHKNRIENRKNVGMHINETESADYVCDFETLLIHVNQFGLKDADNLTVDTIRIAQEEWLFDHTIYIDSRIPETDDYRDRHMTAHIHQLIKKFPNYLV